MLIVVGGPIHTTISKTATLYACTRTWRLKLSADATLVAQKYPIGLGCLVFYFFFQVFSYRVMGYGHRRRYASCLYQTDHMAVSRTKIGRAADTLMHIHAQSTKCRAGCALFDTSTFGIDWFGHFISWHHSLRLYTFCLMRELCRAGYSSPGYISRFCGLVSFCLIVLG